MSNAVCTTTLNILLRRFCLDLNDKNSLITVFAPAIIAPVFASAEIVILLESNSSSGSELKIVQKYKPVIRESPVISGPAAF